MRKIFFTLFLAGSFLYILSCSTKEEILSVQESDIDLKFNEIYSTGAPDWLEIYNPGSQDVDISGFLLYDAGSTSNKTILPQGTIVKADSFLVWLCDDIQANFKLSSGGEAVTLEDADGKLIDFVEFPALTEGTSYGRNPDGADSWQIFGVPTPGTSNTGGSPAPQNHAPVISNIKVSPQNIDSTSVITIYAEVTDEDGDLSSFTLFYGPEGQVDNQKIMMAGVKGYFTTIGPFPESSVIWFYLQATDEAADTTLSASRQIKVGYVPPKLYINEFMASNDTSFADENGDYDDWIEIYNPDSVAVDIGGMFISDDLADLTAFQIPATAPDSTTIPPKGFLVLWADKESEQGVLHVEIKLSGGGEQIALTAPNGAVIDSLTYGEQTADISYGRTTDGGPDWQFFTDPTPGASNNE